MGIAFRRVSRRGILWLTCLCLFVLSGSSSHAEASTSTSTFKVMCRPELAAGLRQTLSEQLRAITGWPGLHFDADGMLRFGDGPPSGGSPTARALLTTAQAGKNLIVIEDASGNDEVVFGRVVEGRWKETAESRPPVFLVQIDFTDFSHVMGDREARAAFNAGWGLLHEVDHVVNDSVDADGLGMLGECEDAVNLMRRECGLAERGEYFYTFMPGADHGNFRTRFVRLPFERTGEGNKRRRYWLYWDAELTGVSHNVNQTAAR